MLKFTEQGYKFEGFYRGEVVAHGVHGKCKIWIPGVYSDEFKTPAKRNLLPDAEPASPLFGGSSNGDGVFSYPKIGSIVWCFFANGDQTMPVYFAGTIGGAFGESSYTPAKNGWHILSNGSSTVKMNESTCVVQCADSVITLSNGNISIETGGTVKVKAKNVNVDSKEAVVKSTKINVEGDNVNVKGNTVNVDGKSGDVKISGISLVSHRHITTAPGSPTTTPVP